MLLHEVIELAAVDRPDDTALVFEGRRLTFDELCRRVHALRGLLGDVVGPGEPVLIVSDNHLDVVTALYAVPAIGATLAFANTRHTPAELATLTEAVQPSLVVASPGQLDRIVPAIHDTHRATTVFSIGGPHDAASADLTDLLDRATRSTADPRLSGGGSTTGTDPAHVVSADDCAWLIHTSGTTGRAKGVRLTHTSLLAAVANSAIARPMADDDVYLFPFPLFHVAAYNVVHAHLRRRPVVLVPRFDAAALLELIEAEQVTNCSLAPTMVAMLLDHPARTEGALATLRQISYGASSMPLDLLRRVLSELPHCGLAQGYGMTELSGNAAFLSPEEHRLAATDAPHLLAAAGRPGPLVAIRIVDDDDRPAEIGDAGEILVRGDQVCDGYWNDPAATAESTLGGWFRTGDIGRFDHDGFLYVVDRLKDLIITGGENVASREVEDVMSLHPDVAQNAVVGVPDQRWGEVVCAVVVPAPGAASRSGSDDGSDDGAALVEWTDGRMAGFKRPRRVVFVDELPVNASGKVDKRAVRRLAAEALNSQ